MPKQKALFLDRDGVINRNDKYVHKIKDFYFMDGIMDIVDAARDKGYKILIVTNQGGIGYGYHTEEQFLDLMEWLHDKFDYDDFYYCPHHPEEGCYCRKPEPGMLLKAANEWDIDVKKSIMIGDMETDMGAAKNAGIGKKILLQSNLKEGKISSVADVVITHLKYAQEYL